MFGFVDLAARELKRRRLWDITVASWDSLKKHERREIQKSLREPVTEKTDRNDLPDETRRLMIASSVFAHGNVWLERHPKEKKWLDSTGFTIDQALRDYHHFMSKHENLREMPLTAGALDRIREREFG